MALKNRDLVFIIKVQNQAKAALRSLQGDLTATGKSGNQMAKDLDKAQAVLRKINATTGGVAGITKTVDAATASSRRRTAAIETEAQKTERLAAMVDRSVLAYERQRAAYGRGDTPKPTPTVATPTRAPATPGRGAAAPPVSFTSTPSRSVLPLNTSALSAAAATANRARTAIQSTTAADNALTRAFDFTRDAANQLGISISTAFGGAKQGAISGMLAKLRSFAPVIGATVASFAAFTAASAIFTGITSAVGGSISAFANFDKAMAQVRAVSLGTAASTIPLRNAAKEIGVTTEFGATQAANALAKLIQNGLTANQAIAALVPSANLATVGQLDLADASDSLTKILAQYNLGVEDAAKATDVLNFVNVKTNTDIKGLTVAMSYAGSVASAFGISLNETAAAIGVLGNAGIQGSAAGTAIRAILLDLTEFSSGTAPRKALEVFKNLKIDPKNIDPGRVSLAKALDEFKKAGASRADLNTLFQKRGVTPVLSLLNQKDKDTGESSLTKVTRESKSAGGFNAQQAATARDNLLTKYEKLKGSLEVAGIALLDGVVGRGLASAVEFLSALANAFSGVIDPANQMNGAVTVLLRTLKAAGIGLGIYLLATKTVILGNVYTALSFSSLSTPILAIPRLLAVARASMVSFGTSIKALSFASFTTGVSGFFGAIVSGAKSAVGGMRLLAVAFLSNPIGIFVVAIGAVIAFMAIFSDQTVSLGGQTTELGDILAVVFDRFVGAISSVIEFFGGLVNTVLTAFGTITASVGITSQGFFSGWKGAINAVIGAFVGFALSVGQIISNILAPFKGLASAAGAALTGDFAKAGALASQALIDNAKVVFQGGAFAGVGTIMGKSVAKDYVGGFASGISKFTGDLAGGVLREASSRTSKRRAEEKADAEARQAKGNGRLAGSEFDAGAADGIDHGGDGGKSKAEQAARRSGARAAETFVETIKKLQDKFDPQTGIERQFSEDIAALSKAAALGDDALRKLGISREELTRVQQGAQRQLARDTDFLYDNNRALDDQAKLLGFSRDAREVEAKVLEVVNKAEDKNRKITEGQITLLRSRLIAAQALAAFDEARNSLTDDQRDLRLELLLAGQIVKARDSTLTVLKTVDDLRRKGVTDETALLEYANEYNNTLTARAVLQAQDDLRSTIEDRQLEARVVGVIASERDRVTAIMQYQDTLGKTLGGNQEEINRLTDIYVKSLDAVRVAQKAAAGDAVSGVREGLQSVRDEFGNLRGQMTDLITGTFSTLSTSIQDLLKTGKFSFGKFFESFSSGIIEKGVNALLGSAAGALDGALSKQGQTGAAGSGVFEGLLGSVNKNPAEVAGLKFANDLSAAYATTSQTLNAQGVQFAIDMQAALNQVVAGTSGATLTGTTAVAETFVPTLTDGLASITAGIKNTGTGFLSGFGGSLDAIIKGLGGGGSAGGLIGSVLSIGSLLFAKGGIMSSGGKIPIQTYSRGGIAKSPQLAMFGEGSSPEAYVPVPSGRIPVEIRGNTQPQSTGNIVIAPQITLPIVGGGGGSSLTAEQAGSASKALEAEMGKFMERWVTKEQRSGGRLNPNSRKG